MQRLAFSLVFSLSAVAPAFAAMSDVRSLKTLVVCGIYGSRQVKLPGVKDSDTKSTSAEPFLAGTYDQLVAALKEAGVEVVPVETVNQALGVAAEPSETELAMTPEQRALVAKYGTRPKPVQAAPEKKGERYTNAVSRPLSQVCPEAWVGTSAKEKRWAASVGQVGADGWAVARANFKIGSPAKGAPNDGGTALELSFFDKAGRKLWASTPNEFHAPNAVRPATVAEAKQSLDSTIPVVVEQAVTKLYR